MSWIKIRTNLVTDPAVAAIGMRIKMHPRQVVGCLVSVWCWADPLTADGWVPHATVRLIDDVAGKRGFADAMVAVEWLTVETSGVRFPKWDRHNSQSAKARAGEAERKRLQRTDAPTQQRPDTTCGQTSGVLSGQFPDQRRGEEIREEENTSIPATGGANDLVLNADCSAASAKPPKDATQLRAEALMRRRPTTPMSAAESRAWKTAKAVVFDTDEASWKLLEWWFSLPADRAPYRKTDFAALLNNWHAEVEKARRNHAQKGEYADAW